MKKIIVSIIIIGLLLTTSIASVNAFNIEEESMELETSGPYFHAKPIADIYVDDDAPSEWYDATHVKTIQEGVNNATVGDIVYVFNGTYYENVIVNKSVDLLGEDKKGTVIDGMYIDNTIWINTSFVSVSDFTIINSINDGWGAGIYVIEKHWWHPDDPPITLTNIDISSCIIKNNDCGIRLTNTYTIDISNCIISDNFAPSIYLLNSSYVSITQCEIHDNGNYIGFPGGIFISDNPGVYPNSNGISDNIVVSNCNIFNNEFIGIAINAGSYNVEVHHNNISENTEYGIQVREDSSVNIHDNILSNNGNGKAWGGGISLSDCINCVTIKDNLISSYNPYGIFFLRSSGNTILENKIINNGIGIRFYGTLGPKIVCSSNNIIANNITNNGCGIEFNFLCINNHIYYNNFEENTKNAYDEGINIWYNLIKMKGNYWDDYTGEDNDGDGIGDEPYIIPPYNLINNDRFPIMKPYNGTVTSIQVSQSTPSNPGTQQPSSQQQSTRGQRAPSNTLSSSPANS